MSDLSPDANAEGGEGRRGPRRGLLPALLFMLCAAGGGFYATWSGRVTLPYLQGSGQPVLPGLTEITYLPVEPIRISLGPAANGRHLRFSARIETASAHAAEVTQIMPRILDVLNSYLRAVEPQEIEDPGALTRLRAQMLRRIQMVAGEGRVRDLLIAEFVLN